MCAAHSGEFCNKSASVGNGKYYCRTIAEMSMAGPGSGL